MENKEVINKIYINGSFLIHLYDKLDKDGNSYFCPQIKIEQLLIIANLEYYKKYKEKMNELDLIYERTLGYHFDTSNLFFRSPITISRKINDKPLSKEELLKIYPYMESNIMYFSENYVDAKSFETLINVFAKFASYSPKKLKDYLDKQHKEIEEIFENINYKNEFNAYENSAKNKYNRNIELNFEYNNSFEKLLKRRNNQ